MANSGLALTRGGCNVRTLNLTGPDEETLYTEITHQYLDGLVALDIGPQRFELIRRLREEAGLKVILQVTGNIDADAVGADSFSFDFRQAGVEIGRRLLAEGRSKLYFIFLNQVTAYLLEGIRSAFAAAGKTPEVTAFDWGSPGVFSEIAERLRAEAPEALYVHGEHYDTVRDILDECGIPGNSAAWWRSRTRSTRNITGSGSTFRLKRPVSKSGSGSPGTSGIRPSRRSTATFRFPSFRTGSDHMPNQTNPPTQ
jgi:hypothetical protein